MQLEAHDGYIHAADLFHGECAIANALTIEDHQLRQNAKEHAVRHPRNADSIGCASAAFEERVVVGIKQISLASRDVQVAVAAAAIDQPEQCQQLRPGVEALTFTISGSLKVM